MFSFLFGTFMFGGSGDAAILVIKPDATAVASVAGFKSGAEMRLKGTAGETVDILLGRLNTYRGPDQQIRTVWHPETGAAISGSTVIHGTLNVVINAASLKTGM